MTQHHATAVRRGPLYALLAATVLAGLSSGPFGPIVMAIFQERVPLTLRGRFFGAALAVDNATTSLAVLLAGLLLEGFSLISVLIAVALGNMLLALAIVTHAEEIGDRA